MNDDKDIWDEIGTLTLARDSQGEIDLPPLDDEGGSTGSLRSLLREFVAAPPDTRSRYSLRMANGQTFTELDIDALLSRPDCPI